ncbi:hypothetical protein JMUB6875_40610 [Nocardia sp. JMUB6875]
MAALTVAAALTVVGMIEIHYSTTGSGRRSTEITFGTARPQPGGELDLRLSDSGEALAEPDACALFSDAEITAILPQAEHITRKPEPVSHIPQLGEGTREQRLRSRATFWPRGQCDYNFDLTYLHIARITFSIHAISTPESIAWYYDTVKDGYMYDTGFADHGQVWSADACFSERGIAFCRYGRVYLDVRLFTPATTFTDREWQDRLMPLIGPMLAAKTSS